MYVIQVLCNESASHCHPYVIAISHVVAIVGFDYHTMCPWLPTSHWTATVSPAIKTEGSFQVSLPL